MRRRRKRKHTYSTILNSSFYNFVGCWIETDLAGTVYCAVGDDGLVVDAWEGFWGVGGEDGCFVG